jgi:hypothetical protein
MAPSAETERHRRAIQQKCDRKHHEQHADAQFEDTGIGMRDQHRAQRHTGETADQERPHQREIKAPPHRRQRRGLPHDRTDQNQRHRKRWWQHVEPDAERHQRGSEAGEPRHQTAGERAEEQQQVGTRRHGLSLVIPGRA